MAYFSYKYFVPMRGGGGGDFFQYAYMYEHPLVFSSSEVSSPFVYRQLSAVMTHAVYLLSEFGLYLNPPGFGILFSDPAVSDVVYFAAIVSNYIALVLCAWGVSLAIDQFDPESPEIYSLLGGALCFLSVHTQQHVLTGLTEGWSWVLVAFGFLFYLRRSRIGIALILLLSVVQREMILVVFAIFAIVDVARKVNGTGGIQRDEVAFESSVFALSIGGFLTYVLLRSVLIPVPGGQSQLTPGVLVANLISPDITLKLLLSTFYVQNIVFLYVLGVLYLYFSGRHLTPGRFFGYHILFSFVALVVVGVAAGIGHNTGRISGILTPICAVLSPPLLRRVTRHEARDSSGVN